MRISSPFNRLHLRFVAIEDGCSTSPPSIVACVTLSTMHSVIANAPSAMSAVCIERFKRRWSDHSSTALLAARCHLWAKSASKITRLLFGAAPTNQPSHALCAKSPALWASGAAMKEGRRYSISDPLLSEKAYFLMPATESNLRSTPATPAATLRPVLPSMLSGCSAIDPSNPPTSIWAPNPSPTVALAVTPP
jgi:hypothetical protein